MPTRPGVSGQDWDPVNVGKSSVSVRPAVPKSAASLAGAKAAGLVATEKRFGAGTNSSAHSGGAANSKKLEESEETKVDRVDKSLSKAIMQARTSKKMTQKDLGTKINEKPQVVAEYESGKAIPNAQIIGKLERALGCKLPRPGKKPSAAGGSSGTASGGGGGKKPAGGSGPSSGKVSALTRGGPPKRR